MNTYIIIRLVFISFVMLIKLFMGEEKPGLAL